MRSTFSMRHAAYLPCGTAALCLLLTACTGTISDTTATAEGPQSGGVGGSGGKAPGKPSGGAGGGGMAGAEGVTCTPNEPRVVPLRRLTRLEYEQTVQDLLGTGLMAREFPQDQKRGPFDANTGETIGESVVLMYQAAAEDLARRAAPALWKQTGCTTADASCVKKWLEPFGTRMFRRPLAPAESEGYLGLFQQGQTGAKPEQGLALLLEAMLQSPNFLYHQAPSDRDRAEDGAAPLTSFALAERLSYFLTRSAPDEELLAQARSGGLQDAGELERQVKRLLEGPRGKATLVDMLRQWLTIDELDTTSVDTAAYPLFTAAMKQGMKDESRAFLEHVLEKENGDLREVFTASYSIVNAEVARLYEMPSGSTGLKQVEGKRYGILTHPSVLTVTHGPVLRGKLIRTRLLCADVPPPPANVDTTLPPAKANETERQRLENHAQNSGCKGCHDLMDPLGFAFDHFDAIGRARTTYDGKNAIDARGTLLLDSGDIAFDGNEALTDAVLASPEFAACAVRQVLTFALADVPQAGCLENGAPANDSMSVVDLAQRVASSKIFSHVTVQP